MADVGGNFQYTAWLPSHNKETGADCSTVITPAWHFHISINRLYKHFIPIISGKHWIYFSGSLVHVYHQELYFGSLSNMKFCLSLHKFLRQIQSWSRRTNCSKTFSRLGAIFMSVCILWCYKMKTTSALVLDSPSEGVESTEDVGQFLAALCRGHLTLATFHELWGDLTARIVL